MSILSACSSFVLVPWLVAPQEAGGGPTEEQVLMAPEAVSGARFGSAVCWLDFDGDGEQELAVGAPGEGAVYLFLGPELERVRRFALPDGGAADGFGAALGAGEIDEQAGEELIVGAPGRVRLGSAGAGSVFQIASSKPEPVELNFPSAAGAALGSSLAVGDFDDDGFVDVAAGAPKAPVGGVASGAVYVRSPRTRRSLAWNNPIGKWEHGNFGHALAAADGDGNGSTDLFVSGIGNRNAAGLRGAGQVYAYPNPAPEGGVFVAEDPHATEGDGARFGMSVDAGDLDGDGYADLLVGAPRKDGGGVEDAGAAFVFFGPGYGAERARVLLRPAGEAQDVFGFRVLAVDVVGGPEPDALCGGLGGEERRVLSAWDVAAEAEAPALSIEAPVGASSHWIQGLAAGAPSEGLRAVLALGDPRFGPETSQESGRVVVRRIAR